MLSLIYIFICTTIAAPNGLLSVKTTPINGSTIVVSWNPLSPVEARGFVRYYLVTWTPSSSKARGTPGSANLTADATMFLITGLDPMVTYTISVSAGTSAGVGVVSTALNSGRIGSAPCRLLSNVHHLDPSVNTTASITTASITTSPPTSEPVLSCGPLYLSCIIPTVVVAAGTIIAVTIVSAVLIKANK